VVETGQFLCRMHPGQRRGQVCVVFRCCLQGIIERACAHINFRGAAVCLKRQRGAAVPAKGPRGPFGRVEGVRHARQKAEVRRRNAEPGHARCTADAAANAAMAYRLAGQGPLRLVPDRATKAATAQRSSGPVGRRFHGQHARLPGFSGQQGIAAHPVIPHGRPGAAASWVRPACRRGRSASPGGRCAPRCPRRSPATGRASRSRARFRSGRWPP
jgi:hypothetical protein